MIYDKIKELCKKKNVSVGQVEKRAGLGKGTIGKWNNSKPTVDNLLAVAKELGEPMEYFLEDTKSHAEEMEG